MKRFSLLYLFLILTISLFAQSKQLDKVATYCNNHASTILQEYTEFLSIPNVASDEINIRKNAAFIVEMMKRRGISNVQLLEADTKGTPPAVYGEVNVKGAKTTLLFYAHYDGQPVNHAQWNKKLEPFAPKLLNASLQAEGNVIDVPTDNKFDPEWRIYARGASDDKAGVFAALTAYDALIKSGGKPASNLKFIFEGEEEAGSGHLDEILKKNSALLKSDLLIICDGPVHQTGRKQIVFGVRGDAHVTITVYASKRPLHSGHYGNWAPNPGLMLANLLTSMKVKDGRVTIKDFYDDVVPLTETEKTALKQLPPIEQQMMAELGIKEREMTNLNLSEAIMQPSLNINGMAAGNVGKMASNQIPTHAEAVLDLRLVLGNDWRRQQQKVIDHVKLQGYYVIDREPTDDERAKYGKIAKVIAEPGGYNAQRTSMDLPVAAKVIEAVKLTTPDGVVLQPSSGGSLPLYLFKQYLDANTITVPIANHDNNQHAENENIRLGNLFEGFKTIASLMLIR